MCRHRAAPLCDDGGSGDGSLIRCPYHAWLYRLDGSLAKNVGASFSRQVTVLAYQYGAGLCDVITPTNGALMAVIAAARVRFDDWLRFVLPRGGMLFALGAVSVLIALAIGLS